MPEMKGKGLRPGEWDIMTDRIDNLGNLIESQGYNIFRFSLIKNTTWDDILKTLPKGAIIKDFRQVR